MEEIYGGVLMIFYFYFIFWKTEGFLILKEYFCKDSFFGEMIKDLFMKFLYVGLII